MIDLSTFKLSSGSHGSCFEGEACLIEAATVIKGWQFTDHPDDHISPVLSAFGRAWNDALDDEGRQQLKRYIDPGSEFNFYDTANDGQDEARGWLAADWMIREFTPAWLELAGVTGSAQALRELPEIRDMAGVQLARPVIDEARKRAARAAAVVAAVDAAWAAARAAAGDAAWAAVRAAAVVAARAAAGVAARDAAGDAAWAAAWDAAGVAARDALKPTEMRLQESAHRLLERMIDPAAAAKKQESQ